MTIAEIISVWDSFDAKMHSFEVYRNDTELYYGYYNQMPDKCKNGEVVSFYADDDEDFVFYIK